MSGKHLNVLFPTWQGSGEDRSAYDGAFDLKRRYFEGVALCEVEVSTAAPGPKKNRIVAYDDVLLQLRTAKSRIEQAAPDTIFAIGGGCDADVAPVAYCNEKTAGDLAVVWFDAHGDLNTPESSPSGLFYGMPLRALLGEGDAGIGALIARPLLPSQVVMAGLRDLDRAEKAYIDAHSVCTFSAQETEAEPDAVLRAIRRIGARNVYVHIDLDVLDPDLFPHTPVHAPGGLRPETLTRLLRGIADSGGLVGIGLYEYVPADSARLPVLDEIVHMGSGLGSAPSARSGSE